MCGELGRDGGASEAEEEEGGGVVAVMGALWTREGTRGAGRRAWEGAVHRLERGGLGLYAWEQLQLRGRKGAEEGTGKDSMRAIQSFIPPTIAAGNCEREERHRQRHSHEPTSERSALCHLCLRELPEPRRPLVPRPMPTEQEVLLVKACGGDDTELDRLLRHDALEALLEREECRVDSVLEREVVVVPAFGASVLAESIEEERGERTASPRTSLR